jgi:hypothetical protein
MDMPLAPEFKEYDRRKLSCDTTNPVVLNLFSPTVRLPLGSIVLGRSEDKCSDANVGFFVRHDDEWDWLRSLPAVHKIKDLLSPEEYKGKPFDTFDMPNTRAVHFLPPDHLERMYDACSTYDTLGKNVCEYLRAKTMDIPVQFVQRGVLQTLAFMRDDHVSQPYVCVAQVRSGWMNLSRGLDRTEPVRLRSDLRPACLTYLASLSRQKMSALAHSHLPGTSAFQPMGIDEHEYSTITRFFSFDGPRI